MACGPNQCCNQPSENGAGDPSQFSPEENPEETDDNPCTQSSAVASLTRTAGGPQGVGNPINLTSGNKYLREVDLPALPGSLGLEIVRHHNSEQTLRSGDVGVVGRGWRLSYETRLLFKKAEDNVVVKQADGRTLAFVPLSAATGLPAKMQALLKPVSGSTVQRRFVAQGGVYPEGIIDLLNMDALLRADGGNTNAVAWQWMWPSGRTLQFNGRGSLVAIGLPSGHQVALQRDPEDRILRITDPQGRNLHMVYGDVVAMGYRPLIAIDSPVGRFEFAQKGGAGMAVVNLVQVQGPDEVSRWQRQYHYESEQYPSALTGLSATDEQGNWRRLRTYSYTSNGRADQTEVNGQTITLKLTGRGQNGMAYSQAKDKSGRLTSYRHELIAGQFRLVESIGHTCEACSPANRTYRYDALGRLLEYQVTGPNQQVATRQDFIRDDWGRLVEKRIDGQWAVRYAYPEVAPGSVPSSKPIRVERPSVVEGQTRETHYEYNAFGQVIQLRRTGWQPSFSHPDGRFQPEQELASHIQFEYKLHHGKSVLAQIDGPLPNGPLALPSDSDITRIRYSMGSIRPVFIERPGGFVSNFAYGRAGRLASVHGPSGQVSLYQHNYRGLLTHVLNGGQGWGAYQARLLSYNPQGKVLDASRSQISASDIDIEGFAKLGLSKVQVDALKDAAKPEWKQAFDDHGKRIWHANHLGMLSYWSYGDNGQLTSRGLVSNRMHISQQYEYDSSGRLAAFQDQYGKKVRLVYSSTPALTSAAVADAELRSKSTRNSHRLYDDFGRLIWLNSPDTGITVYRFNGANQLVAMQDANLHQASYLYDSAGRVVHQRAVDSRDSSVQTTQWAYRGEHLVKVQSDHQTLLFQHDNRGLLVSQNVRLHPSLPGQRIGGGAGVKTYTTTYQHDESGVLVARTLPDGSQLQYQRNGQGQVVGLYRKLSGSKLSGNLLPEQAIVIDLKRDLKGLSAYRLGNGVQVDYRRGRSGQLGEINAQANLADPVARSGLQMRQTHWWNRGGELLFKQTSWGQSLPLHNAAYAYDQLGQLLAVVHSSSQKTGSEKLPKEESRPVFHALAGGSKGWENKSWRFAYDGAQRMRLQQAVHDQSNLSAGSTNKIAYQDRSYRLSNQFYDPAGNPLQSATGEKFHWDAYGRLAGVVSSEGKSAGYWYDHRGLRIGKQIEAPSGDSNLAIEIVQYLYSPDGSLLAELDSNGDLMRQYINLGGQTVAVIDLPECAESSSQTHSEWAGFACTAKYWANKIVGKSKEQIYWLHYNHLQAPVAATDSQGRVVWQANYAPYGQAEVSKNESGFHLNLRLPGQYFDAETGLHYNRARYYNSANARYLSPDPLGTPDGPNPYAYVAYNPVRYVDPDGLVLFAFDGTENAAHPSHLPLPSEYRDKPHDEIWYEHGPPADGRTWDDVQSSPSNVRRFMDLYRDGPVNYVSGVGSIHKDLKYGDILPKSDNNFEALPLPDRGGNWTAKERIRRMSQYFYDLIDMLEDDFTVDIDIIGFSRGAVNARLFAREIAELTEDGWYKYFDVKNQKLRCQRVNLRFLGVWDTVVGYSADFIFSPELAVPAEFTYVAHAVALNEFRESNGPLAAVLQTDVKKWEKRNPKPGRNHFGGFGLESIGNHLNSPGFTRVERGFLGAHSDIGGAYPFGERALSEVALSWMVRQAQNAGVAIESSLLPAAELAIVHDESNVILHGNPELSHSAGPDPEDRRVNYSPCVEEKEGPNCTQPQNTRQRKMIGQNQGMVTADTYQFIDFARRNFAETNSGSDLDPRTLKNQTGTVRLQDYIGWLKESGYEFSE